MQQSYNNCEFHLTSRVFGCTRKSNPCLLLPYAIPTHIKFQPYTHILIGNFGSLNSDSAYLPLLMIWLGKKVRGEPFEPPTNGFPTATPIPSRAPGSPTPTALHLEVFCDEDQDSAEFQLARPLQS